jgi:hypothetical protein
MPAPEPLRLPPSLVTPPQEHSWFDGRTPLVDLDLDELREMALAEARTTRGSARDTLCRPLPPTEPASGEERRRRRTDTPVP